MPDVLLNFWIVLRFDKILLPHCKVLYAIGKQFPVGFLWVLQVFSTSLKVYLSLFQMLLVAILILRDKILPLENFLLKTKHLWYGTNGFLTNFVYNCLH